ncbi:hypothetical protein CROQUDRAFT_58401 [Cronartium quercuum f. sp. fusiforme G11]|uniref:ER-bound oxygenase mpaB/mpaB'/Rubber oxygenase catalytic domain-containing protein n=1 Tax=Cronartium quercuum f. sp. fusiforme G11 TaxID=708437 RepID=A0A9P6NVF8_9BASI|nr:hypothetical protein CROQUDRAFT_58401 [Cronartium quercuum f. sp. fusiforme G11]
MLSMAYMLTISLISGSILAYLLLVHRLRFANRDGLSQRFVHLNSARDMVKMTSEEARQIVRVLSQFESPYFLHISYSLALLQTYAVPRISSLLNRTGRLAHPACAGRRAEDTVCLLMEAEIHGPESERGLLAISRINFIHRIYGSAITRDDMLFTLTLAILEPTRLIDWLDWRPSTDLEKHARFVLWRDIGTRMGITDIPSTPQALADWLAEYRLQAVAFAESNNTVGETSLSLFLRPWPALLRPILRRAVMVFIPDDIRQGFGWPAPSAFCRSLVYILIRCRAFCIRHFFLPRQSPFDFGLTDTRLHTLAPSGKKLYQRNTWLFEPWYVRQSSIHRVLALLGFTVPSSKFHCEGYSIESLGPENLSHLGGKEVELKAELARSVKN